LIFQYSNFFLIKERVGSVQALILEVWLW